MGEEVPDVQPPALRHQLQKQVLDGRRRKEPKFTPAAVTTFGELGPGCTVVQEWLAMRLKAHLTSLSERPDGVSVSQVVGRFRADFRLSLMMVAVRRAAAMLLGSGLPGWLLCAGGRCGQRGVC